MKATRSAPSAATSLLRDDGTVAGSLHVRVARDQRRRTSSTTPSDQIFGVALDKTGQTLGIHGAESYFSAVDQPFTQRLQGKKTTFAQGAGITFHPNADGTGTAAAESPRLRRLGERLDRDGGHRLLRYQRGALATKYNLYGPLRASLPFPGDDPSVLFKLFGVSRAGLVVIDVTAADILAGP